MTATGELYDLLPALYRIRDVEHGGALEALLEVLERETDVVELDIEQLYENWFIETCDSWVVAYIGDLLRVRRLHPVGPGTASLRAYVANTLGYRRRKGTVAVIEQLAYDVTGWRAKAVEFFQLLETTQYAKHVRLQNVRTPDLRDVNALELVGGPFEQAAHTAEVRRIASGRGRYNLPNIGVFVWRLDSYPLEHVTARRVGAPADGHFTFSPVGLDDVPLFNRPRTETALVDLATELDVPAPLRRRPLGDELESIRQASVDSTTPPLAYFADPPVLQVFTRSSPGDAFAEVPTQQIMVADLSLWQRPPKTRDYTPSSGGGLTTCEIAVAVDPVLGRLTFPAGQEPEGAEVSSAYGFAADVGGGPYDRSSFLDPEFARRVTWQRGVGRDVTPVPDELVNTLADAIAAWNAAPPGTVGVIAVLDSRTYAEALPMIEIAPGSELLLVAADWPESPARLPGTWVPSGRRPHVQADFVVSGTEAGDGEVTGRLALEGLLVEGRVHVLAGDLGGLRVGDCTFVPGAATIVVESSGAPGGENDGLEVELQRSIVGGIELAAGVPELSVDTCIVDADPALAAPDGAVRIAGSTILGSTSVRSLQAENSIFTGAVTATRRQIGCVRFCFVPRDPATATPRRYACQPDLALRGVDDPALQALIIGRLVPVFTSTAYGAPAYGQLGGRCPIEIQTGAEDGSELGAFMFLHQPQRVTNLGVALDEYLPLGLEAGVVPVT
jgi:hypothetical protein